MWSGGAWGDDEWAGGPHDRTPPFLLNRSPGVDAVEQPLYANIVFDLVDADTGVDITSINVTVNGVPAITAGVFQPGYGGTIVPISAGYTVTVNPDVDFALNALITVVVNASDLNWQPNAMVPVTWSFDTVGDTSAPVLSNPAPIGLGYLDAGYARNSHVTFDITDVGFSSVSLSSVVVTVEGLIVFTGGAAANGYTVIVTPIPHGFHFDVAAPALWDLGQTVDVSVDAADNYAPANVMPTTSWSFLALVDDAPPQVVNNAPVGLLRPLDEHIRFDVIDTTLLPLIPGSVVVRVNGVIVWQNLLPENGYTVVVTPIPGGFHYDVQSPFDWVPGGLVTVSVDATDSINVMPTTTWTFVGTTAALERCNPAPLLPVEIRLRSPFTQNNLERMRRSVLTHISRDHMLDHRIRGTLLTAHFDDFRPVLTDVLFVPAPILAEIICKRRKLFAQYTDLLPLRTDARAALEELRKMGLSEGYLQLISSRLEGTSPQQYIGALCAMLLLGALLSLPEGAL